MQNQGAFTVGGICWLIAIALAALGRNDYSKQRAWHERGVTATATVASREGPFVDAGSRYRVDRFKYLLEYDRHQLPITSRWRYDVGQQLPIVYDRGRPQVARVLRRGETGRENPSIPWRYAIWSAGSAVIGTLLIWVGMMPTPREPRRHLFSSIKTRKEP